MTLRLSIACLLIATLTNALTAQVVRFEITERKPFAGGHSFGKTGPYERIVGKIHYQVDPRNETVNIIDLDHASKDGKPVSFSSDLFILAPKDLKQGNGQLLYDVNNRGRKLALRFFNDAEGKNNPLTLKDAGNGFLMRHGYTIVWNGWDGELLPGDNRMQLHAPVATRGDKPITGLVRYEISLAENATSGQCQSRRPWSL